MEEFNENCSFPIQALSCQSDCSQHDALFLYSLCDIDHASEILGIPWEASKDQSFAPMTIYIGFTWDLDFHTVSLAPDKIAKYLNIIREWLDWPYHILKDAQSIYGKLLHACAALHCGCAYLIGLKKMMCVCADKPFMPHWPVKSIEAELCWWTEHLQCGEISQPIKPPTLASDPSAYSDASSGCWRAWLLHPEWKSLHSSSQ